MVLFKSNLDIVGMIGIILLIGIVKKNAIMMIDFALAAERNEGMDSRDAIYQACLLRFRPIMMTTMCALLGGMPMALGWGAGAELRKPLGIAIVGGLLVSQMLTLFTTPGDLSLSRPAPQAFHVGASRAIATVRDFWFQAAWPAISAGANTGRTIEMDERNKWVQAMDRQVSLSAYTDAHAGMYSRGNDSILLGAGAASW